MTMWPRLVGGLWREVHYTVTQLMHSECGRICRGAVGEGGLIRGGLLYVRGNNCDTDDVEYYVNHLMVAVLRELDGDTLLYYRSKPHHDGSVMTGCRRQDCLRKI